MYKYLLLILGTIIGLLSLYSLYVTKDRNKEREARLLVESNLEYVTRELKNTKEALEKREDTLFKLEEETNLKDQEIERLRETNNEARDWLMQIIPSVVDNTIPY